MTEPGPSNNWAIPPTIPNRCTSHNRHECRFCDGRPSLQSPPRPHYEPPVLSNKYKQLQDQLEDKEWLELIKELKNHWPRERVTKFEDTFIEQSLLEEYYQWTIKASWESEQWGDKMEVEFFAQLAKDILIETESVVREMEGNMQGPNWETVREGEVMRRVIEGYIGEAEAEYRQRMEEEMEKLERQRRIEEDPGLKKDAEMIELLRMKLAVIGDEHPAEGVDAGAASIAELLRGVRKAEERYEEVQAAFSAKLAELLTDEERETGVYDEEELELRIQADELMMAEVESMGAIGARWERFKDEASTRLEPSLIVSFQQAIGKREMLKKRTTELDELYNTHLEAEMTDEELETGVFDEAALERRCEANPALLLEVDILSILRLDPNEHGIGTVIGVIHNKIEELESSITVHLAAHPISDAIIPPLEGNELVLLLESNPLLKHKSQELTLMKQKLDELSTSLERLEGTLDVDFLKPLFKKWRGTREVMIKETEEWLRARIQPKEVRDRRIKEKPAVMMEVMKPVASDVKEARGKTDSFVTGSADKNGGTDADASAAAPNERNWHVRSASGLVLFGSSVSILVMWFLILRVLTGLA